MATGPDSVAATAMAAAEPMMLWQAQRLLPLLWPCSGWKWGHLLGRQLLWELQFLLLLVVSVIHFGKVFGPVLIQGAEKSLLVLGREPLCSSPGCGAVPGWGAALWDSGGQLSMGSPVPWPQRWPVGFWAAQIEAQVVDWKKASPSALSTH